LLLKKDSGLCSKYVSKYSVEVKKDGAVPPVPIRLCTPYLCTEGVNILCPYKLSVVCYVFKCINYSLGLESNPALPNAGH